MADGGAACTLHDLRRIASHGIASIEPQQQAGHAPLLHAPATPSACTVAMYVCVYYVCVSVHHHVLDGRVGWHDKQMVPGRCAWPAATKEPGVGAVGTRAESFHPGRSRSPGLGRRVPFRSRGATLQGETRHGARYWVRSCTAGATTNLNSHPVVSLLSPACRRRREQGRDHP